MDASTATAATPLAPLVYVAHQSHRVVDATSGVAHGVAAVVGAVPGIHGVSGLITGGLYLAGAGSRNHTAAAVASHAGLAADAGISGLMLLRGGAHHGAAVAGEIRTFLRSSAHALARIVPIWTIGVGTIDAADGALQAGGPSGLISTQSGRRGVLDVLGGALMLVPHPIARMASAGAFATSIINDLVGDTDHGPADVAQVVP